MGFVDVEYWMIDTFAEVLNFHKEFDQALKVLLAIQISAEGLQNTLSVTTRAFAG